MGARVNTCLECMPNNFQGHVLYTQRSTQNSPGVPKYTCVGPIIPALQGLSSISSLGHAWLSQVQLMRPQDLFRTSRVDPPHGGKTLLLLFICIFFNIEGDTKMLGSYICGPVIILVCLRTWFKISHTPNSARSLTCTQLT